MKTCAIVGINWGDEGKGRIVDLLTSSYDYVIRYQGGGNAGHTVINDRGTFALHLLPSGIFHDGVINILGNGVALDPENLWKEIQEVRAKGISLTPENLKISNRASLLLPWHRDLDALEEKRLADAKAAAAKYIAAARALCNTQLGKLENIANEMGVTAEVKATEEPKAAPAPAEEAKPEGDVDEAVRAIEKSAARFQADEQVKLDMPEDATERRPRQRKLENTQPFTL